MNFLLNTNGDDGTTGVNAFSNCTHVSQSQYCVYITHYTLPYLATKGEPYHNGSSNKDFLIVAIIYRSD